MKKISVLLLTLAIAIAFCGCTTKVEDEKITLQLPYGDRTGTYTGEMNHDLPNGEGVFKTKNESGEKWQYEGEFVDGLFEGKGKSVWKSGQIHEGTYSGGWLNGEGSVTNTEGKLVYKGNFKDDEYSGEGAFYNGDKVTYKGMFENGKPVKKEYIKATKSLDYTKAAKNPDKYFNQASCIKGKIVQVIEGKNGYAEYRIDVSPDSYETDTIFYMDYTRADGEPRIIEDEYVTVYGQSLGLFTYETTAGNNLTIPYISAYYIK